MTNQETIYKLLAQDGDCWHEPGRYHSDECAKCKRTFQDEEYEPYNCSLANPDLTAAEGAYWIKVRLLKWGTFIQFCEWWTQEKQPFLSEEHYGVDCMVVFDVLLWDSKPSALFDALCEFLELGVER